jgi:hypothetical protein
MGAGSGPAALQLAARIQDAKARAEKEQHDRDREEVRDEQIKDDARRADQRILQKHIDQQIANERRVSAETDALLKREKAFAQDREEPAYRIAIHGLNVFDPDFPSHLSAVNARYPNISVTDKGRGIAALKMADAGMKFTAQGIEYIPGQIQDTYRKAEAVLGYDELRDLATYSRSTGKFLEIDAFEVEQSVHRKRAEAARKLAAPGEDFTISERGGVTIRGGTPPPPKPVDPAKEASEKARDKRWKDSHRLQINNNQLKEWHIEKEKLTNSLSAAGDKQQHLAKIRYAEGEIKKLQDDSDRILKSHEQEDAPMPPAPDNAPAPPVPKEVPGKQPERPAPSATGAATITPESIWGAPQWVPESLGAPPASITPTKPASKRKTFLDRLKELPSQPQASAKPDMDTLTASASDFSRFSGKREEIDSDPDLSAEFNAAAESMSQTLQSLGYDEDAAAASGGYVADGSTIEFEQDEDGEPVAVTVDPDGARTPLKKAASEAVVSIDSSSTAA